MAEMEALGDLSREALFWSKQPHDTAHTFRRGTVHNADRHRRIINSPPPVLTRIATLPIHSPTPHPDSWSVPLVCATASYVPFGLRLLHAELPQHVGNGTLGLDRLYALLSVIRGVRGPRPRHPLPAPASLILFRLFSLFPDHCCRRGRARVRLPRKQARYAHATETGRKELRVPLILLAFHASPLRWQRQRRCGVSASWPCSCSSSTSSTSCG